MTKDRYSAGIIPVLFVIALTLLLSGIASAETYSIRVAHNTNLRASHSLDSAVLASARAGTTLQVVGSFNRWLQVQRDGRDYWMADWVSYSRVEDQPVTPSADIDNCCFVDRQCQTDQQWRDGYWAYQNKQCGAPATAVSVVSPSPETAASASDVDNCCFLGWNCQTDHEWERGFWNYQVGQCEHQGVIIEGSQGFKATMDEALKLLRERSPHWYWYILDGLSKIREVAGSRLIVNIRSGDTRWGRDYSILRHREIVSIAAALAHEACHVHNRRSGQFHISDVFGDERACTQVEIQALEAIGAAPWLIRSGQNLLANIHKPECQWWHNPEHSRVADHCFE